MIKSHCSSKGQCVPSLRHHSSHRGEGAAFINSGSRDKKSLQKKRSGGGVRGQEGVLVHKGQEGDI